MRHTNKIILIVLIFLTSLVAENEIGKPFLQLGHHYDISSIAFSPDAKFIVSGSNDGAIKLWDIASGKEIKTFGVGNLQAHSIAFSPNGKTIASGGANTDPFIKYSGIKLWDITSGKEIKTFTFDAKISSLETIAFSPDGKTIASGSRYGAIKLWDIASGREIKTFGIDGNDSVLKIAFSPDGKTIASRGYGHEIFIWDIDSGKKIQTFSGHNSENGSIAFSPDGKTIVSSGWSLFEYNDTYVPDGTIKLWNIASGKEIKTFRWNSQDELHPLIFSVAFSQDGKTIAGNSNIGEEYCIKLWDVDSEEEIKTFVGDSHLTGSIVFSPDGKTIASGAGTEIKLWDIDSGKSIKTLSGHSDQGI
mgnify:CR=1 FL=1